MKTPKELEQIRIEARRSLDAAAALNHALLAEGKTHTCDWEGTSGGMKSKVGRGTLTVYYSVPTKSYPGVRYSSNYGANADNSYSGFIPGVTFEEALLLVWGQHQKKVNPLYLHPLLTNS